MKILNSLLIFFLCSSTNAKQLELKKVSEGSNWLMHIDFDSMRNSEIGSFFEDSLEKVPEMKLKIKEVKKKFGVDVMELSNFTMFGNGEKHKGIGILEGGIDASVVTKVTRSRDYIEETKYGKKTVFSTDKGRCPLAFSVLKKDKIVFGPDGGYVSEGIALANGKGAGASEHALLRSLSDSITAPGFLLFANIKGVSKITELDSRIGFMANKIDSCGMVIGDQEGSIKVIALIETNSEESSIHIEQMINGGFAMMQMKVAKNERMNDLVDGHSVSREGKLIRVEINFSNLAIIDRLEEEMKKKV